MAHPDHPETIFADSDIRGASVVAVHDIPSPLNDLSLAKKLHDAKVIYGLYGMLDGLSLSYSMVKYTFDVLCSDSHLSSSDWMHEWMMTPGGALAAATEAVVFMGFSFIANLFDDKHKNKFIRYTAILWPYCRDTFKGLKNAYKGVRSAFQALSVLGDKPLNFLIVPVGVTLGALSILNRIWYRRMISQRKDMMRENNDRLLNIKVLMHMAQEERLSFMESKEEPTEANWHSLEPAEGANLVSFNGQLYYINKTLSPACVKLTHKEEALKALGLPPTDRPRPLTDAEKKAIKLLLYNKEDMEACFNKQTAFLNSRRYRGLLSQAYSGVVDGLYLYMGALGVAILAPPVFAAMAVFSTLFTILCIVTRVYEERDYQRDLLASQKKVELAVLGKELQELCHCHSKTLLPKDDDSLEELYRRIKAKAAEFEQKRMEVADLLKVSTLSATLLGLRNGLFAYSALSSVLFATATIMAILSVPCPPLFLITIVSLGVASLVVFTAHALYKAKRQQGTQSKKVNHSSSTAWEKLAQEIKQDKNIVERLQPAEYNPAIFEGTEVDPSPQNFFQQWFEVVRSFFSGVAKGQKSVDYTASALQEKGDDGHYHDSGVMLALTAVSSALFSVGLALRAYARGLGKPPIEKTLKLNKAASSSSASHPASTFSSSPSPSTSGVSSASGPMSLPLHRRASPIVNSSASPASGVSFASSPALLSSFSLIGGGGLRRAQSVPDGLSSRATPSSP